MQSGRIKYGSVESMLALKPPPQPSVNDALSVETPGVVEYRIEGTPIASVVFWLFCIEIETALSATIRDLS